MDVNYWGSLRLTHAVVPFLREAGDGRVIMINASASRVLTPGYGAYSGSKAALLAMSRGLAKELGPWGIRVNSVAPSKTDTPNFWRYVTERARERGVDVQVVYDEAAGQTALRYIPTSDEVAAAVLFFASPLGSALTGQVLHPDAGFWCD
jgi:NAD(P)-dependent dehydrogenase (short-subunit alcohol dehydrogenase family)